MMLGNCFALETDDCSPPKREKERKKKRCLVCWCTDIVDFEYKRGSDVSVTKLIFGHTIRSVV